MRVIFLVLEQHQHAYFFLVAGQNGGPCTACVAGKFKSSSGSQACSQCDAGKFVSGTASVSLDNCLSCGMDTYSSSDMIVCVACPSDTTSSALSSIVTACICNVGYTGPNGVACTECPAGQYKEATGSAACTMCGAGTSSEAVAASSSATCIDCSAGNYSNSDRSLCVACPSDSSSPESSDDVTDCLCNVGFSGPDGDGGPCLACVGGKFKISSGQTACSLCSGEIGRAHV